MAKPQPPYARLNQPPRSPNGRNRLASKKNHSDPLDGAGASAGGAKTGTVVRTQLPPQSWRTFNPTFLGPGVSPGLDLRPGGVNYVSNSGVVIGPVMTLDDYAKMIASVFKTLEPPPIPYNGIHSGELTGHRAWLVTDTLDLCSLAHYFVWEPGKTIEGDINEEVWHSPTGFSPPRFGGVYAYSSFDLLKDDELVDCAKNRHKFPRLRRTDQLSSMHDFVAFGNVIYSYVTYLGLAYGTVKLWGETVEHEKGYRASFAKLVSIDGFIGVEGFDLDKLRGKYLP